MDVPTLALQAGVVFALAASLFVVWRLDRPRGAWGRRLRSRLLLGVPWGTLVVVALVSFVYFVVQRGFANPYQPLHIPFTSWSYCYPLGVLTAPFAHQSLGHLTGNLVGTIVLAPLAEYAFSHFPTDRGTSSFATWKTNPYLRAFVVFPAGAVGVGILTSLFAWGPIIGFSGVVYAFAGFALVRYPLATVIALAGRDLVSRVYYVLQTPIVEGSASSTFQSPWWAGIAIQGHLLGFLLGATLASGLLLVRSKAERPSALRLWAGGLVAGSNLTLWAIWWYRSGGGYVLYQAVGVVLLVVVAVVVALAVETTDATLLEGLTRRQVGVAILVVPILTMSFVAVPLNATMIQDDDVAGQPIDVGGYAITYAENVPNRRVRAIDVSAFGATSQVNASGVIVVDPDRTIWTEAIPSSRLAFYGHGTVVVGGLRDRTVVTVTRRGWTAVGGDTAYQVALEPENGPQTWVFASESVRTEPTIDGKSIAIRPRDGRFRVSVRDPDERLASAQMPPDNGSVRLAGLTITNRDGRLYASSDGTRVRVATRERYN